MSLIVQNLCEQSISAYGGREPIEQIRTIYIDGEQNMIPPTVPEDSSSRIPLVPCSRKTYIAKARGGGIRLRVETENEYGLFVTLISNGQGKNYVKFSQMAKQSLPDKAVDRVEPLTESMVRSTLQSFVQHTPIEFLLDYQNRNAQYKGTQEVPCGLLQVAKLPCHHLQFTLPGSPESAELLLDVETMLAQKLLLHFVQAQATTESVYSGYRNVQNIMMPHASKFSIVDKRTYTMSKVHSIEFNRNFPKGMFTTI